MEAPGCVSDQTRNARCFCGVHGCESRSHVLLTVCHPLHTPRVPSLERNPPSCEYGKEKLEIGPQEHPVGPQEHHVAATAVAIPRPLAEERATSTTGPVGGNVGIAGSACCNFNFCKRSSPSATPCTSTSLSCSAFRNASLASAMVASCCKRRFFALATYSSVARICFSNGGTCACRFAFSNADNRTCLSSVSSGWRAAEGSSQLLLPAIAPGEHSDDWLTPAQTSQADELAAGILHVATASMVDACHGSLEANRRGLPLGSIPS